MYVCVKVCDKQRSTCVCCSLSVPHMHQANTLTPVQRERWQAFAVCCAQSTSLMTGKSRSSHLQPSLLTWIYSIQATPAMGHSQGIWIRCPPLPTMNNSVFTYINKLLIQRLEHTQCEAYRHLHIKRQMKKQKRMTDTQWENPSLGEQLSNCFITQ